MRTTLSDVELAQFKAFAAGAEILHTEVELTTAEILALFTTPKELVATPGTRHVHEFISAVLILDYNSAAYATRGDLTVGENDGSGTTTTVPGNWNPAHCSAWETSLDMARILQPVWMKSTITRISFLPATMTWQLSASWISNCSTPLSGW